MKLVSPPSSEPGPSLRAMRLALGMTARKVEEISRSISKTRGNPRCFISHSELIALEKSHIIPSIHKLHSLSTIYMVPFNSIVGLYGIELHESEAKTTGHLGSGRDELGNQGPKHGNYLSESATQSLRIEKTTLLPTALKGTPGIVGAFAAECARTGHLCGYIGMSDYTLNPIIRPGALVEIDCRQKKISKQQWYYEYDRPVYFVELHDQFVCAWCEVSGRCLLLIPHPGSNIRVRQLVSPDQAEVVGRVKSVLQSILDTPIRHVKIAEHEMCQDQASTIG